MDANGLRFSLLLAQDDWDYLGAPPAVYEQEHRMVRLAPERLLPPAAAETTEVVAAPLVERIPEALDVFGNRARWDAARNAVVVNGQDAVHDMPGVTPTDIAVGPDAVMYIAAPNGVTMVDLHRRWQPVRISTAGFTPWRVAPDPVAGAWVLDRDNRQVGRVRGRPLPDRPFAEYASGTFRPCEENPDPPRIEVVAPLNAPGETIAGIGADPDGRVAVLTWSAAGAGQLRWLSGEAFEAPITLTGAGRPFSLALLKGGLAAVLIADLRESPVFDSFGHTGAVTPIGDLYPLPGHDGGPFLHTVTQPPHFPVPSGSTPLHHLSLPAFAKQGSVQNRNPINSGSRQTVWHRLYLDASIPQGCYLDIRLAATDEAIRPASNSNQWHLHRIGIGPEVTTDVPRGVWCSQPSELPFQSSLVPCDLKPGESGLFMILIQRAGLRVRSLQGQYLWVEIDLFGNGRTTPGIAALRAWSSRFSYANNYLPELYRENLFGPSADLPGKATPADFLERYLDIFESVLTPLEGRVADSWLLTDAATTPDESLEWLGSWIGVTFEPAIPPDRRRRMLEVAPVLFRTRGTLLGLQFALEVATGGGVTRGEIVAFEDFRLRRTFATILGADLANESDPLLGGLVYSGNSYVGDTLILGEEERKEFLSLFNVSAIQTEEEQEAVDEFLEALAFRATVLVHQGKTRQDVGLIRRIVQLETPAHTETKVLEASFPLLVGIASLVGIDTAIEEEPEKEPVRVGRSQIGVRDFILGLPSLAWLRRQSAITVRPLARISNRQVSVGESFRLDALGTRVPPGRRITNHLWTLMN